MTEKQFKDFEKVKRWCDEYLAALYKAGQDLWGITARCIDSLFPGDSCSISFSVIKRYIATETAEAL